MNPFNDSEDDDLEELAAQFKQSVDSGISTYFDNDDYQDIIAYLVDTGEIDYAKKALTQAIQLFPNESYFRLLKAKISAMEFNFSEAMDELDYIEANFEIIPEFYIEKVLIAHAAKQDIDGIPLLKKALEMDEAIPEAHLLLAHEYLSKRDVNTAVKHAVRAIQLDNLAAEDLKIVTIDFQDFFYPNDHILIKFFQMLTDELPMCASLWSGLGLTYMACSKFDEAIDAFQFQLSLNENDVVCYMNLAEAYFEMGRYEEALQNFNQVSEKCDWLPVNFQKGNCYFEMGDYDQALDHFMQVMESDPMYYGIIPSVVKVFERQGRYDEARAYLKMKLDDDPSRTELIPFLIELLDPHQDEELVRQLLNQAIQADEFPEQAFIYNGQTSGSMKAFNDSPLYSILHFFTVYCYKYKAPDLGIEILEEYVHHEEIGNDVHYFLAALYLSKYMIQKGIDILETAIQAAPESYYVSFANFFPTLTNWPEVQELVKLYHINPLSEIE